MEILEPLVCTPVPPGADEVSFSPATLQNARLTFEDALGVLAAVTPAFEKTPTFTTAVDLCLAIRNTWLLAFPEWRRCYWRIGSELAEFHDLLSRGLKALRAFQSTNLPALQKEKVTRFCANTKCRLEMTEVLLNENLSIEDRIKKVVEIEASV
jgi:hypothetical protein